MKEVELVNNYIILAAWDPRSDNVAVTILDGQNPTSLKAIGTYTSTLSRIDDMVASDQYVFLATSMEGIDIIDISDPTNPVHVVHYEHLSNLTSQMVIVDDYLYFSVPEGSRSSPTSRWHILDISNPYDLHLVNEIRDMHQPLAVSNNYILTAKRQEGTTSSMQIIDVSNPTNPVILSENYLENLWVHGIEVSDNIAFVSVGTGLRIFDISDPHAPKMIWGDPYRIGSFSEMDMNDNIIVGDFIFALETKVEDESVNVEPLARLDIEKFNENFCSSNTHLGIHSDEIKSALCSNPTFYLNGRVNDLVVEDGYVYVGTKRPGLLIFQLPQQE